MKRANHIEHIARATYINLPMQRVSSPGGTFLETAGCFGKALNLPWQIWRMTPLQLLEPFWTPRNSNKIFLSLAAPMALVEVCCRLGILSIDCQEIAFPKGSWAKFLYCFSEKRHTFEQPDRQQANAGHCGFVVSFRLTSHAFH